VKRKTFDI